MTEVRLNVPLITTNVNGLMPLFKKKKLSVALTPQKAGVCVSERDMRGEKTNIKREHLNYKRLNTY